MPTYKVKLEIHGDKVYLPGESIELDAKVADNLRFIGYLEPAESGESEKPKTKAELKAEADALAKAEAEAKAASEAAGKAK